MKNWCFSLLPYVVWMLVGIGNSLASNKYFYCNCVSTDKCTCKNVGKYTLTPGKTKTLAFCCGGKGMDKVPYDISVSWPKGSAFNYKVTCAPYAGAGLITKSCASRPCTNWNPAYKHSVTVNSITCSNSSKNYGPQYSNW